MDFKHHAYVVISEQNIVHNVIHINMNDTEFNAAYIPSPYYGVS